MLAHRSIILPVRPLLLQMKCLLSCPPNNVQLYVFGIGALFGPPGSYFGRFSRPAKRTPNLLARAVSGFLIQKGRCVMSTASFDELPFFSNR
jgi:hypothetical protein